MLIHSFFVTSLYLLSFLAPSLTTGQPSCSAGTFISGNRCVRCPPGTYQPLPDTTSCIPCPPGTFNIFRGAQGVDLCEPCRPNTFNNRPGATSPSMCRRCPPERTSVSGAARCRACPPNTIATFSDGLEETYRRGYNFCTFRNIRFGTSFRLVRDPNCYAGNYPRNMTCSACTRGFVRRNRLSTFCRRCGDNFIVNPGSRACRERCSGPGLQCVSDREVPCSSFQFNDNSQQFCRNCPPGFIGNSRVGGTFCVRCPEGTYKGGRSLRCRQCRGANRVVGRNSTACLEVNNDVPCPVDTFRHADGYCESCETSQRYDPETMTCERCPSGLISGGGLDQECRPCPAGSELITRGLSPSRFQATIEECQCSPGWERAPGEAFSCQKCQPGFSKGFTSATSLCRSCAPGSFASGEGATSCQPCQFNFVAPNRGQTQCDRCPRGMVPNPIRGCVSSATNCPLGSQRVADANNVIVACNPDTCPEGTQRRVRSSVDGDLVECVPV